MNAAARPLAAPGWFLGTMAGCRNEAAEVARDQARIDVIAASDIGADHEVDGLAGVRSRPPVPRSARQPQPLRRMRALRNDPAGWNACEGSDARYRTGEASSHGHAAAAVIAAMQERR